MCIYSALSFVPEIFQSAHILKAAQIQRNAEANVAQARPVAKNRNGKEAKIPTRTFLGQAFFLDYFNTLTPLIFL